MPTPILVTPGCPKGVGPELSLTLPGWVNGRRVVLVTEAGVLRTHGFTEEAFADLRDAADAPGTRPSLWCPPPGPSPIEVRALDAATDACLLGAAAALVTGPIHKARLAAAGVTWIGHTERLAERCGVPRPVMAFVGGSLRVALVTVHLPLRAVADAITAEAVLHTLRVASRAVRDDLGVANARILVCGLNPHAGDEGVLGDEDAREIAPAVARARAEGIDAIGPISAEAAFLQARRGEGDLIVAMYHDQGLAPLKAVDFGRSVNWTLGLPILRTSVDHGTANALVGTGRADPGSLHAALALAAELAAKRHGASVASGASTDGA